MNYMINSKIRSGRRTAFYIPSLISGRAANTIPDRIRKYPKERPQKSAYYLIYLSKDEAEINANGYSRKRKTKVDFVAIKSYNINRILLLIDMKEKSYEYKTISGYSPEL